MLCCINIIILLLMRAARNHIMYLIFKQIIKALIYIFKNRSKSSSKPIYNPFLVFWGRFQDFYYYQIWNIVKVYSMIENYKIKTKGYLNKYHFACFSV